MTIKKTLLALTGLLMAAFVSLGYAGVYKCKSPQGQIVFQDHPCPTLRDSRLDETSAKEVVRENQKHFLWKASSNGNTIHLFGSVHFGSNEMYPLPDIVNQAFDQSDALVVELNTNQVNKQEMALIMSQSGTYPEGDTIQNHISPETWEKLSNMAKSQNLDLQQIQQQKPWMISLSLAILAVQKSGFSPEFGIDQYFITGAEGRKPILELETLQQQLNLFNAFSAIEENRFLKETLDQLEQATSFFRSMLEAWQTGDTMRLQELTQSEIDSDPAAKMLYDAIFVKRNHAMADKIVKLSQSGENYFVVVGAGHLVGAEGIVELLRAKGFEIRQL